MVAPYANAQHDGGRPVGGGPRQLFFSHHPLEKRLSRLPKAGLQWPITARPLKRKRVSRAHSTVSSFRAWIAVTEQTTDTVPKISRRNASLAP
jgi:hypothetical protein